MQKKLLVGLTCAILATTAQAGVQDKKTIRAVEANIATAVTEVQSSCGNSALEVSVEWDTFKSMIKANKEDLDKDKMKSQWVYAQGGERIVSTLEALNKICAEDEDYKEEIALLTKVVVTAKESYHDYKSEFSLDDTVLNAQMGHRMTRSYTDFIKPIKALY